MKRREALKGLGMSFGLVVATPTVISLLQSCKSDPKIDWTPEYFTPQEGQAIKRLVGLILPSAANAPSATEVNVPEFIDKYAAVVANKEDQQNFKKGLTAIIEASDGDYDKLLAKYLKAKPDQIKSFQENEEEKVVYEALIGLRGISIWGYRNSRKVGMEILAYDPIPGVIEPCLTLEEATGGKAWSLS